MDAGGTDVCDQSKLSVALDCVGAIATIVVRQRSTADSEDAGCAKSLGHVQWS